jgi:hypothetical protein
MFDAEDIIDVLGLDKVIEAIRSERMLARLSPAERRKRRERLE